MAMPVSIIALSIAALAGLAAWLVWPLDIESWSVSAALAGLSAWIQALPPALVAGLLLIGPLLGLPLSAFLVSLGLAFSFAGALAITAIALFLHHLLLCPIGRSRASTWLQGRLAQHRLLRVRNDAVFDDVLFISALAWLPGPSYLLKIAYTALSGVPLRTFLIAGTLAQLIAAIPFLLLGALADKNALRWAAAALLLLVGFAWLGRRFSRRFAAVQPAVPEEQGRP
jgi:uncharacterized membrane protein YdjX (TVP38/TMEM64 family)